MHCNGVAHHDHATHYRKLESAYNFNELGYLPVCRNANTWFVAGLPRGH